MGLGDRLRRGVKALFSRESKALQWIPTWQVGRKQYLPVDYETLVKDGYAKNEVVFACIRRVATSASEIKLRVLEMDGETEVEEGHPLRILLDHPNDYMSLYDLLEATLIIEQIGGTAYWEKERSMGGLTAKLWPIRPDRIEVVPGLISIDHYIYRQGDYEALLPVENVLRMAYFNPVNDFHGLSPLIVCARAVDADNERTDYIRAFFDNAAVPYGLFKTKVKLEEGDVQELRRRWKEQYSGIDNWHNIAIIDVDAEYQPLGLSQTDMAFPDLTALSESRI